MPADAAARNVAAIRQMIAQNDSWRALQGGSRRATRRKPAPVQPG